MWDSEVMFMVYMVVIIILILGIEELKKKASPSYIVYPITVGVWVSLLAIVFHTFLDISTKISTYIAGTTLILYVVLLAVSLVISKQTK